MNRVYNFSAGPAVLPESVLQEAAAEMMNNVIGMLLVISANTIARKASDTSLY